MSLPKPKYALDKHCSIAHEGTLYVYSPEGFQSLKIGKDEEWQALPMHISLTGAQCVKAVPGGNSEEARLYLVGGTPNATAEEWGYPGMMYYSIKNKKWDWIRSETWKMQKRLEHSAVYLDDMKSILVYSGSQVHNLDPSPEVFLMRTEEPYTAISSQGPWPLRNAQLKQWDTQAHGALLVGGTIVGGDGNKQMWTYQKDGAWKKLDTTLAEPIANPAMTRMSLIAAEDGSKVLEIFDMGASPNKVSSIVLQKAGGVTAAPGTTPGQHTKRMASIADWPTYNSTNAPMVVRAGSDLAQGDDDTVIITGGSKDDPLAIFDQQQNSWKNATEVFRGKQSMQNVLATTYGTTSATATSSHSASASPSAPVAAPLPSSAPVNSKDKMLTVLGATLGAIFGIAAILILLLFCLKYNKKKKRNQTGGFTEKDRLSFADRGNGNYMNQMTAPPGGLHKFQQSNSNSNMNMSQTSLAIIGGRATGGHKKAVGSDASTSGLVKKASPLGYTEPVELSKFNLKPEPNPDALVRQNSGRAPLRPAMTADTRSRSSGWSRYFANNEATNLAQMPADRSTFGSDRTNSMYTDSRYQPSQAIPPLDIPKFDKFDQHRMSKVARGSPTMGNSQENLPSQAMQAQISRANSNGSTHSGYSRDDHYLRDGVDSWSPMNNDGRPASSNYTGSVLIDDFRQADPYYADTQSYYPKSNYSSFNPGQKLGEHEVRESTATTFPGVTAPSNNAPSQQQQQTYSEFYPAPPQIGGNAMRESNATVFPSVGAMSNNVSSKQAHESTYSDYYPAPPRIGQDAGVGRESTVTVFPGLHDGADPKAPQQDMSWLNLGTTPAK
jgi:hypothetical protein